MGVGEYVHSKETRQHQPRAIEVPNQLRQALAEQARVEVPTTTLHAPVPITANRQAPIDRYGTPFHEHLQGPTEKAADRDVFDTDVEAIDDSTIAATSVMGVDDIPYRLSPAAQANATTPHLDMQQQPPPQPSPSPPRQFRSTRRTHESKWYEGLGDRALKSAGFDLDDADDTSQLTSTAGDDELSNDADDQRFKPRYRAAEEPLSQRIQSFWTASRRTHQADDSEHAEPSKPPSYIPIASTSKHLPASARKVTLARSMTATPRTRFSPPKPSLLDQLDLTPTRHTPGITRTQSQREREKEATRISSDLNDTNEGLGLFANDHARSGSMQSLNVFDMTNFDDLENDSSMNDPFSRRPFIRRTGTDQFRPKKRHLEPDYPPEILRTKSFSELQAEPFDKPPSRAAKEKDPQLPPEQAKGEDKISFLLRLSEQERGEYFAKLSMHEWEEHGDLLVEQFAKMISKMKELRHARRRTAAVFEAEIKRRHDFVEEQSAELSGKFDDMRAGGAEVLRGRSP